MEKDEVKYSTDITDTGLRGIAKGSVRFTIKADDTLENLQVHSAFKDFCRVECDNNYTQGLRKLIEMYELKAKDELLFNTLNGHGMAIEELRLDVDAIKAPAKPAVSKENEEKDTF